jgi:hypothetical protein
MWGMLPTSHFSPLAGPSRVSRMNRWTLGGESRWVYRLLNSSIGYHVHESTILAVL